MIPEDAKGKDQECEEVTSIIRVTKYTSQVVLSVLYGQSQSKSVFIIGDDSCCILGVLEPTSTGNNARSMLIDMTLDICA